MIRTLFLVLLLMSCNVSFSKKEKHAQAVILNNKAISTYMSAPDDSLNTIKAINILNNSISMDSEYFIAYWNKLAFENEVGLLDSAFHTLKKMERIWPGNPNLKMSIGIFFECNFKDIAKANSKYHEAELIYQSILGSHSSDPASKREVSISCAIAKKLLRKDGEADSLFHSIIQSTEDETVREYIDTCFIQKKREQLLMHFYPAVVK
jgi:hypothetical protein